jgi:hypothetical protein
MKSMIQRNKRTQLFVVLVGLACFALPQIAHAVLPPPDGGYPGGNTAEGQAALLSLTTGTFNTAVGWFSLRSNNTNSFNTATGAGALFANTADQNTATGAGALLSNSTGSDNTASGAFALSANTTGFHNTATGVQALLSNTTGSENTACGLNALAFNTIANENTAVGSTALFNTTTGAANTAIGFEALASNTSGMGNIAVGDLAGSGVTTANNVICIGAALAGDNVDNTTWISGIYGSTTESGVTLPVIVSAGSQLGVVSSSRRFKKEIKPMDKTSESVLALKPVTFQYKSDKTNTLQFGLVAEDVAAVNPDLVVRDKNGEIYTVRYDAVNAMLLNEFLKEHKAVLEERCTVQNQQKEIDALRAELKEQKALIQKVSAQLEVSRVPQQTMVNNQ